LLATLPSRLLTDFQNSYTNKRSSKFEGFIIKRDATLPCEILMSENWQQSVSCLLLVSFVRIAQRSLYYSYSLKEIIDVKTFFIHSAFLRFNVFIIKK